MNLKLLGKGYLPSSKLLSQNKIWNISKRESVKKISSSISDRLLASMLYPATGILNNELCSPTDLSTICIKALGYRYSTPDLISSLPKTRLDYLLRSHLNARKPIELGPLFLPFGSALNNIKYFEDII